MTAHYIQHILVKHVHNCADALVVLPIDSAMLLDSNTATHNCSVLEANLDALRIAGQPALDLAASYLADPDLDDPGLAAAATIVLLEPSPPDWPLDPDAAKLAVAGLSHPSAEIRDAVRVGLRLGRITSAVEPLTQIVRSYSQAAGVGKSRGGQSYSPHTTRKSPGKQDPSADAPGTPAEKALAMTSNAGLDARRTQEDVPPASFLVAAACDALAFHRRPLPIDPRELLGDDDAHVRFLAVEAAGRSARGWSVADLARWIEDPDARVRAAALRAAARAGAPGLSDFCRKIAGGATPCEEVVEFIGVVGGQADVPLLRKLSTRTGTSAAALRGLGRLGFVSAVPILLEALSNTQRSSAAAVGWTRLFGEPPATGPLPDPPPGLSEDELDLWEPIPPLDLETTRVWWSQNEKRLAADKRYQAGLCVSEHPLGEVFDQLPSDARLDIHLRERSLRGNAVPDWELESLWPHQRFPRWAC